MTSNGARDDVMLMLMIMRMLMLMLMVILVRMPVRLRRCHFVCSVA